MNSGILFCLLGTLSFGLLGCASKGAERRNCQAEAFIVMVYVWATIVMVIRTAGVPSPLSLPFKAVAVAIGCGACAAIAYYAFQLSISFGKVAVGWLMMNVSAAIPAIVSIFVYGEKLTRLKIFAFGLALISLFFIFRGRRAEMPAETSTLSGKQQAQWLLLMLVILATNGMSAYGLKVIAAWGLPETAKFPYLSVWYAAGLATIGVPCCCSMCAYERGRRSGEASSPRSAWVGSFPWPWPSNIMCLATSFSPSPWAVPS